MLQKVRVNILQQQEMQGINIDDVCSHPIQQLIPVRDQFNLKQAFIEIHNADFDSGPFHAGSKEMRQIYGIDKDLKKYFGLRYFLFSMFDDGIKIDRESWYSVIAEPISQYLCQRLQYYGAKTVFEPFCGVGGLSIQFAGNFKQLVVNDWDPEKIGMLKNNLTVYGKGPNMLKIYNKDVFDVQPFKTDCCVVCPPWGGINTQQYASKDLDTIMEPKLSDILNHCRKFSPNMVLQMPKTTNIRNFVKIVNMCGMCPLIRIENIRVNEKPSQLFIYVGDPSFTGINPEVYSILQVRKQGKNQQESAKQKKKDIKEKIKGGNYDIFSQLYHQSKPNKHIFFEW